MLPGPTAGAQLGRGRVPCTAPCAQGCTGQRQSCSTISQSHTQPWTALPAESSSFCRGSRIFQNRESRSPGSTPLPQPRHLSCGTRRGGGGCVSCLGEVQLPCPSRRASRAVPQVQLLAQRCQWTCRIQTAFSFLSILVSFFSLYLLKNFWNESSFSPVQWP